LLGYLAYNFYVPTPFYHLSIAEELLKGSSLPAGIGLFLQRYRGEYMLGNISPDVQVFSGQRREATHFFELPVRREKPPAWERILRAYPALASPSEMTPAQVAFLCGYLCHLQADWFWVLDIFVPVFGLRSGWDTFPRRLYLHNVLRAYLDQRILPTLPDQSASHLTQAAPEQWLPFVADQYLREWRDYLAKQLQPGEKIHTVDVLAARQGASPEEYYRLLASEEHMDREIFSHLPRQRLNHYRTQLVIENERLIQTYLIDSPYNG